MENYLTIDESKQVASHISTPLPGRIRAHALKPQHSKVDYARRKSTNDVSVTISPCSNVTDETDDNDDDHNRVSSWRHTSSSWLKRRVTMLSIEQSTTKISCDHQSECEVKGLSDRFRNKRASVIVQLMEVHETNYNRSKCFNINMISMNRCTMRFSHLF
jgi:hypothetical protein